MQTISTIRLLTGRLLKRFKSFNRQAQGEAAKCHSHAEDANTQAADERGGDVNCDHRLTVWSNTPRTSAPGTWVEGTIRGYRFQALVFALHAKQASYELGDSRISKLWIADPETPEPIVNFDRGWDIRPQSREHAKIVETLCQRLANQTFGPL